MLSQPQRHCVQERAHHCTRRTALLNTFKHVSCCHV